MSAYELTFLINDEEEVKNLKETLASFSAKITEEKNWGKRTLAYPINKETSASYYTWDMEIETKNVNELKKKLNFNEKLLRYLLLKI